MSLSPHLFIVAASVEPAVEDDWNRWYNEVHLPEIGACPGFRSAQRYRTEDAKGGRRYVAIYELDGPEAMQSAELAARRGWAQFTGKVEFQSGYFTRIAEYRPETLGDLPA
jgi:hypothetical protein